MTRPIRYALDPKDIDRVRWPHAVSTPLRHVRGEDGHAVLAGEILDWLRANVRRGGWRFSAISSWLRLRVVGLPKPISVKATLAAEVTFACANDALAFRMRWG